MNTENMNMTSNEAFNHRKYVTVLVNKLINGLNGKNVSATAQAYCIAGLCRELESMVHDTPKKAFDATDLFFQSYIYAAKNDWALSIGWWGIIGNEIIDYYYEIVEFEDEDVNYFKELCKEVSTEAAWVHLAANA